MPSKAAMKAADNIRDQSDMLSRNEIAVVIDSAIQEACKPLADAAEKAAEYDWAPKVPEGYHNERMYHMIQLRAALAKWQSQPEQEQKGGA